MRGVPAPPAKWGSSTQNMKHSKQVVAAQKKAISSGLQPRMPAQPYQELPASAGLGDPFKTGIQAPQQNYNQAAANLSQAIKYQKENPLSG